MDSSSSDRWRTLQCFSRRTGTMDLELPGDFRLRFSKELNKDLQSCREVNSTSKTITSNLHFLGIPGEHLSECFRELFGIGRNNSANSTLDELRSSSDGGRDDGGTQSD